MRWRPLMVEHLAKVAAIHPLAARRAPIKMLGFVSGRIAHATTDVLHARELNDRAVLFRHLVPPIREPRPRALGQGPSEPFRARRSFVRRSLVKRGLRLGNTSARQRFLTERPAQKPVTRQAEFAGHRFEPGALKRRPTGRGAALRCLSALCLMSLTAWTRPRRLAWEPR